MHKAAFLRKIRVVAFGLLHVTTRRRANFSVLGGKTKRELYNRPPEGPIAIPSAGRGCAVSARRHAGRRLRGCDLMRYCAILVPEPRLSIRPATAIRFRSLSVITSSLCGAWAISASSAVPRYASSSSRFHGGRGSSPFAPGEETGSSASRPPILLMERVVFGSPTAWSRRIFRAQGMV